MHARPVSLSRPASRSKSISFLHEYNPLFLLHCFTIQPRLASITHPLQMFAEMAKRNAALLAPPACARHRFLLYIAASLLGHFHRNRVIRQSWRY